MEVRNSTLAKALLCIPLLAAAPCMTMAMQPAAPQTRQPDAGQQTTPPDTNQSPDSQAAPSGLKAVMLSGTITRDGSNLVLKDESGTKYQLDAQEKAAPYEGKSVQVTGKLDSSSNTLHVDEIHPSGN
jgi:uncharacterized protein YdeI (BOF family)